MKNAILIAIASLFCVSAFCDECWSTGFRFDGSEITEEAIILKPTDPLAYSSALAEGEPKSLTINVEDTTNPEISASVFADYSETAVEGTTTWDYTDEDFKDFPTDDTYLLTETVTSDAESKVLKRTVTILPEPMGLLLIAFIGALILRKRTKSLIAVLAIITICSFNAKADGCVSNVNCLQMWPFDRSVVINYTLTSDNAEPVFDVKFYGSLDNGETTFDLAEKGTITRDGANGTIAGTGEFKTIWTPDESFYETYSDDMLVKVEAKEKTPPDSNTYMVIDLSGGTNATSFAINYLDDVPEGGWTEEYKTTKLVLRKVEAGKFTMGSPEDERGRYDNEVQHEVILTKDFYIGVFETTQKQYELIKGGNPACYQGDARPVEYVSYNMIRGSDKGSGWPANSDVDSDSFLGVLRAKTNQAFDLPTEAQWEYACRAGTTTALNNGTNLIGVYDDGNMNMLGRYYYNYTDGKGGYSEYAHTTVGSYLPNAWGLYDMHGNVCEWCLDWWEDWNGDSATDPKGNTEGSYRLLCGGSYSANAAGCRSANRYYYAPSDGIGSIGLRVALTISDEPAPDPEKYMVVDLSGGTNATSFAINYLDDVPEGGWTEEYKTTKLVLRKVESGKFTMGSPENELGRYDDEVQHEVTLTKPFFAGVFEVTQKQYELITGNNPAYYQGDARPVEYVSYNMLRGTDKGAAWPANNEVDATSFFGILRAKTGLEFDLPTEAQWEFTCRAGTTTALNSGKNLSDEHECEEMAEVGRYWRNGGSDEDDDGNCIAHAKVGSYLPNAWGLYDLHGNVWEWCLDWYQSDLGSDPATDPKGNTEGRYRLLRGGSWFDLASGCRSAYRNILISVNDGYSSYGFRVFLVQ